MRISDWSSDVCSSDLNLGRAIVTGQFDDEAFPTEAELTKRHGVSRSVTREAVKMLTAKGLLSARPRQGTVIQPTSSWNLFDTDVLRWLLERQFSIELLKQFNRSEKHKSALQSQMHTTDAVSCLKKTNNNKHTTVRNL